ncbi:hypothetical protein F2Q69_00059356 [Brassica cretica]|uniref:Uncharacterized protein n=1 Tax=Brassica cretica TaxID=69181 RepID=A0A8S9RCT1_BRACR|nr:hypothetical protein F2Q69_00059356 [Brassica cretica]
MAGYVRWVRYGIREIALKARPLRSDRANTRSLRSDRTLVRARPLRIDRAEWTFGRYVATELWLELGRYVAIERSMCLVAA